MNPKNSSRLLDILLLTGAFCLTATPALQSQEQTLLFDFGGADAQTAPPPVYWNNITEQEGSALFGSIAVVDLDGNEAGVDLFVDEVFDLSPNESGSEASASFPASASRDSLVNSFGNATLALVAEPGAAATYTLTFYSSDTSAGDNRETRFTVSGASTETVDLNPSGNVDGTVSVEDMALNAGGEITVNLSPGPNHSGANSLVYLGVLRIDSSAGWSALIDFGGSQSATTVIGGGPVLNWNNVDGAIGNTDGATLFDIVSADGAPSDLTLQMVSRFNGVNANGTTDSGLYPATATQDSWFGNTEEFSSLSDITPIFSVNGLDPAIAYDFTFYASRLGVGDNRETLYTLTGAETEETALNVANNEEETATVAGLMPDASGTVSIALTPGPNNNNGNHFIYLGVLKIEAPSEGLTYLFDFGGEATTDIQVDENEESWNNVTESVGATDDGSVERLIASQGSRTSIGLRMESRFNGVNRNGTLESTVFPASATRDSLFGNTEPFSGLENVFPAFKLTGLNPENAYTFTFFGSRTATDNRETRYTVSGANSGLGDLNAASNVDGTVTVERIIPDAAGEIRIAIEPGPNNDNGSHFTYLGAMRVEWVKSFVPRILIDAGGTNFPTTPSDDVNVWNNFQGSVGQTDNGVLSNLQAVNGAPMGIGIQMIARFNGVNEAGTQEAAPYPTTATQDSLFGNTEDWSGLIDVFPRFMLTGLDPSIPYDLTFYASRNASDNRETQYTVTGANESVAYLNVAGNIDQTAIAEDIEPTAEGTITVAIDPGPNNDNANHFTYLGVLQIDWAGGPPVAGDIVISGLEREADTIRFTVNGGAGQTYTIQGTDDFQAWTDDQTVTLTGDSAVVEINADEKAHFFRVVR